MFETATLIAVEQLCVQLAGVLEGLSVCQITPAVVEQSLLRFALPLLEHLFTLCVNRRGDRM